MSERPKRRKLEEPQSPAPAETPAVAPDTPKTPAGEEAAAEPPTDPPTSEVKADLKPKDDTSSMTYLLTACINQNDEDVVKDALKKLERFWYDSKKNCQQASDLGAPLSIVSTMRKWEENEEVVKSACLCVLHITYHLPPARSFFLDLGALEVTAAAMKRFPTSAGIHEFGCNLLFNLFLGSKGAAKKTKDGVTKFVKELDGLSLIVETTLENFPDKKDHSLVQMNACAALEKLASNGFRQQVIQSGAVRKIAPIFDAKPKNKELEKVAKELMGVLFR